MNGAALGTELLSTALAIAVLMLATFAVAMARGKHSVVDATWGLGFAVVAVVGLATAAEGSAGVLAGILVLIWGLRLAVHMVRRNWGEPEDPRYENLLAGAPGNRVGYVLRRVYLTQGLAMWFVSLPVQFVLAADAGIGVLALLGLLVWLVGFVFEAVGDWQLDRFRADPSRKGAVLDTGLWRYTRHPNYFGDACQWWGLFVIALSTGWAWLTILSPLAMTYLLTRKTGKPLMEQHLSQTRPAYAAYVRRTSSFLPMPPRRK